MPHKRKHSESNITTTTTSSSSIVAESPNPNKKKRVKIDKKNYFVCPTEYDDSVAASKVTMFMAGGISDCPDWQSEMKEKLHFKIPELVLVISFVAELNTATDLLTTKTRKPK